MPVSLQQQARIMLPPVESELKRQVRRLSGRSTEAFHEMLDFHMGWRPSTGRKGHAGKRIRPLISLLVCASVGGRWRHAVPAAAALELLHNFSLVHDDIEDNSPTRRGRPTLWRRYGVPLAINAGDALFTIANQATLNLLQDYEPPTVVTVLGIIEQACLDLTKGQFLDLYNQEKGRLTVEGYWQMISGKTAALLAACTQVGALLGGASAKTVYEYRKFGQCLGLAFQVEDDILGIWGEEDKTGKSTATDLKEGKLSLPVVYGISRRGAFARLWRDAPHRRKNAIRLRKLLEQDGGLEFSQRHADRLTRSAVDTLEHLHARGDAAVALEQLATELLSRRG
jgi:geranylgeranyl diphosphate synthase type I